jgi:hypothetical protein
VFNTPASYSEVPGPIFGLETAVLAEILLIYLFSLKASRPIG